MNTLEIVRRLKAHHAGRPLPRGETRQVHPAADPDLLILSFVRMGGESRPWGIAFGRPDQEPTLLTVPDARKRDDVAAMAARFAPTLLRLLRCPTEVDDPPDTADDLDPIRQVWLPNPSHLDMLHHLAYAYTFAKKAAPGVDLDQLHRFGRACGWLFREAQRPGQMAVLVASDVLKGAYCFPIEDVRQAHLGALLAWLQTRGARSKRLAAALRAERLPMAVSLDPSLERDRLNAPVADWNALDASKPSSARTRKRLEAEISGVLVEELRRRWDLTRQALEWFRKDPRPINPGVARLVEETRKAQWREYLQTERRLCGLDSGRPFVPSPETDRHPAAAAARYYDHQASADLVATLLTKHDRDLLAEAVAEGDALRGAILSVDDEGEGRRTRPVWKVLDRVDRPLRLRIASEVLVAGPGGQTGQIRSIDEAEAEPGALVVEVEITGRKTMPVDAGPRAPTPADPRLIGREVTLLAAPAQGISLLKRSKIWNADGPGGWLTHKIPPTRTAPDPGDDQDDPLDTEDTANALSSGLG